MLPKKDCGMSVRRRGLPLGPQAPSLDQLGRGSPVSYGHSITDPFSGKGATLLSRTTSRPHPGQGSCSLGRHPAVAPLRYVREVGGWFRAKSWWFCPEVLPKMCFLPASHAQSPEDVCPKGTRHLCFSLLSARHMHRCHKVLIPPSFIAPSPSHPHHGMKGGGTQRESLLARSGRLYDTLSQSLRSL